MPRRLCMLLALGACATGPEPPTRVPPPTEWPAAPRGGLELLRDLASYDTRTALDRTLALERLGRYLEARGVTLEEVEGAVVARAPGRVPEAPPLLLFAHIDVWPADPDAWPEERGPFSAALAEGALYGRGVLGGKAAAALFAYGLGELAAGGGRPARTIWLVVTPDGLDPEGPTLARILGAYPPLYRAGLALGPGGYVLRDRRAGQGRLAWIGAGERGFATLALTAVGPEAPVRLARALAEVKRALPRPKAGPEALRYLEDLAQVTPWPERWLMRASPTARLLYPGALADAPHTRALVVPPLRIGFRADPAGARLDTDARARAWVQIFLLRAEDPPAMRARLRASLGPDLHVDLYAGEPALDAPAFDPMAITRAFGVSAPVRLPGDPSQARLLMRIGIPTAGFVPIEVTPRELEARAGPGERVGLSGLRAGIDALPSGLRALSSTTAADRSTAGLRPDPERDSKLNEGSSI